MMPYLKAMLATVLGGLEPGWAVDQERRAGRIPGPSQGIPIGSRWLGKNITLVEAYR